MPLFKTASKTKVEPQRSKKSLPLLPPPKKFKDKQEADSSNHRLSRIKPIEVGNDIPHPWASAYFAAHPEERVSSAPEERLEQIKQDLEGDIPDDERLRKLAVYEALSGIVYGEDSVEYGDARYQLGKFYARGHRFPSAVRHLDMACRLLEGEAKVCAGLELAYANAKVGKFADNSRLMEAGQDISDEELRGRGWFAQAMWLKSTRDQFGAADALREAVGLLSEDSQEAAEWREELAALVVRFKPEEARQMLGEAAEVWGRLGQNRNQRRAERRRDRIHVPEPVDDGFEEGSEGAAEPEGGEAEEAAAAPAEPAATAEGD